MVPAYPVPRTMPTGGPGNAAAVACGTRLGREQPWFRADPPTKWLPLPGSCATIRPMNKRDLAKSVAVQADVGLKTVTTVLDAFTDVVTAVVSKGEPVSISGFAKFVKVDRPARMGRNPATGEQIRIKASKRARITPVKAFKDAVMSPANAPRLARGAFPIDPQAVKQAGKAAAVPARTPAKAVGAGKAGARKAAPARKAATRTAPARKAATRTAPARKAATRTAPARKAAPARGATKRSTRR